jgi:hypothetical protein
LDDVRVISGHRGYFFCYGNQAILAIKPRTKQIFVSGGIKVVPDGYYINGIINFSNTISSLLSLTNNEFNDLIMEWICNKHPQINSYHKLYDFCKSNAKKLSKVQHLLE